MVYKNEHGVIFMKLEFFFLICMLFLIMMIMLTRLQFYEGNYIATKRKRMNKHHL